MFESIIVWLYAASGVAITVSYLPQTVSAWKSQTGARDVSLLTWGFWCFTSTVAVLYAGVVVKDNGYLLMSLGNLGGCLAVAGVSAYRRYSHKRSCGA